MTINLRTIMSVVTIFAAFSASAAAGTFCEDKADGTYAHPEDCGQFIYCGADGLIEAAMECPAGLLWNDDGQYCDWPEYATCETEQGYEASLTADEPGYSLLFEESVCAGHRELTKKDLAHFSAEEAYTMFSDIVGFHLWDASQLSAEENVDSCMELCLDNEECSSFATGTIGHQQHCFLYSGDETQSAADIPAPVMSDFTFYDCYVID